MTRTVLITGACGGVGRATVALFRAAGWTTAGTDRRQPDEASELDAFLELDISDRNAGDPLARFIADLDGVDALVNNAASQVEKPLAETSVAEWDEVVATNLRGPFLATRAALAALRASRGAIVNVSSVHAIATSAGLAAYVASKGGLAAFTRAAALELAPDVRVNAVLPGAIDTPMLRSGLARWSTDIDPENRLQGLADRTPLRRIGEPAEVAEVILFLADRRSSFITGQTVVVDGGVTAQLSSEQ